MIVSKGVDNLIRLERATVLRNGKVSAFALFEEREGGSNSATHNGSLPAGTVYLRIERRGGRVVGSTSQDGDSWPPSGRSTPRGRRRSGSASPRSTTPTLHSASATRTPSSSPSRPAAAGSDRIGAETSW